MQNNDLTPEKPCSEGNTKLSNPVHGSAPPPNGPEPPDSTVSVSSSQPTMGILTPHLPPPPSHSRPVSIPQADSPATPATMRPNQVRSVILNGVPIVSLVIDGKERLCLAQISNTLLKSFSYNEIHNRRVALGITCVQCTPVQLEILRRAGAMPISSRRCGMITKREAERLCKSFLTENCPPKLPENFSFDCHHECAWGSRGNFMPSRYNSSRAKCIKCVYCNMFFSPNKFIFHSHRLPESKYVQPDAANFNSWRRHLKLSGKPPDDVMYAWEDVKAMFNGGSRKRVMAASCSRFHSMKRPRPDASNPSTMHSGPEKALTYVPVLPYPGSKSYNGTLPSGQNPYLARGGPPPFPSVMSTGSATAMDKCPSGATSFVDYVWAGKPGPGPPLPPSTYGFIWPRQQGLPSPLTPEIKLSPGGFYDDRNFRDDTSDSSRGNCDSELETPTVRRSLSSCSEQDFRSSDNDEVVSVCQSGRRSKDSGFFGSLHQNVGDKSPGYCSAFRPVVRSGGGTTLHTVESLIRPSSNGINKNESNTHVNELFRSGHFGQASIGYFAHERNESKDSSTNSSKSEDSDNLIDVEIMDDSKEEDRIVITNNQQPKKIRIELARENLLRSADEKLPITGEVRPWSNHELGPLTLSNIPREPTSITEQVRGVMRLNSPLPESTEIRSSLQPDLDAKKPANLSKEELEEVLLQETLARKRAEKQCELMKETFQEQVKREVSYREEITKQLEVVKETLCNELDQERKARFAVLQKLKEAHDALHHFSCKMLIPRQCADCSYKPILPQ